MRDSGNPEVEIQTLVTLRIKRNEFGPVFVRTTYEADISEHDPIGFVVAQVNATDADLPVSICYSNLYCFKPLNFVLVLITCERGFARR